MSLNFLTLDEVITPWFKIFKPLVKTVGEAIGEFASDDALVVIGTVLDERRRGRGIEGLSASDASVFPENISNNLNMSCAMVGERAAAFVLEELGS